MGPSSSKSICQFVPDHPVIGDDSLFCADRYLSFAQPRSQSGVGAKTQRFAVRPIDVMHAIDVLAPPWAKQKRGWSKIDARDILRPSSRPHRGRARNGYDRPYVIAEFGGGAGIGIIVLRGVNLPVAIPLLGDASRKSALPNSDSQPGVIVVALFGPVVGRASVLKLDGADPLDTLNAVLHRSHKAQRRAMRRCERRALHFVAQQGLRM